jgi:hypothetical protein
MTLARKGGGYLLVFRILEVMKKGNETEKKHIFATLFGQGVHRHQGIENKLKTAL